MMSDKKRGKLRFGILLAVIECILMLCIYPGGMIRRDRVYSSNSQNGYVWIDNITKGMTYSQSFTAMGDLLTYHSFALRGNSNASDDWKLLYELTDEAGNVLYSRELLAEEVRDDGFISLPMRVRLNKGSIYRAEFSLEEGSGEVLLTCVLNPEDQVPGYIVLTENGELCPAQTFGEFTYSQKLNIRNVIFVWCFLLMIGGCIWEVFALKITCLYNK